MGNLSCISKGSPEHEPRDLLGSKIEEKGEPLTTRSAINPDSPTHSRAGGYRPTAEILQEHDPVKNEDSPLFQGPRWSVKKLSGQTSESILLCAAIFVANETLTTLSLHYWRPIVWSIGWISVTIILAIIGTLGVKYRHSFVLVMFIVLQIMFSAINLQHLNMEHSEAVRECQIPQIDFLHCDVAALKHCIWTSKTSGHDKTCTIDELASVHPPCHAPGQEECESFDHIDIVFWVNQVVNFLTYCEPVFWSLKLVLRLEICHQHEGGDHTTFRKLVKDFHDGTDDIRSSVANELPEEAPERPLFWQGAAVSFTCMIGFLGMTLWMKLKDAEDIGNWIGHATHTALVEASWTG